MSEKEKTTRLPPEHYPVLEEHQDDAGLGSVLIHNNVIAVITHEAAAKVSGVVELSGTLVDELVDRFGKKYHDRGVRVAVESENRIVVELSVILEYGVNIPEVCGQLQQEVRKSIEKMTGKSVQAVNVSVQSLRRPVKDDQEETP